MKLRSFGYLLMAAIVFAGIAFTGSALIIQNRASEADQYWRQYQDRSSAKAEAIDVLITQLGYGGMIHQFKNYVLRKDKKRLQKIRNGGGAALAALASYESAGISTEEGQALEQIRDVIKLYLDNMAFVEELAMEGMEAQGIDNIIKISDKPALEGIAMLINSVASQRLSASDGATKTEVLSRVRAAMGYGGMIHQFKNYVLRQDAPRVAKVKSNAEAAVAALADYRALGVNPVEEEAITAIGGVIDDYRKNVDVAAGHVGKGMTPEEIDKEVKISDKPALEGLQTLVTEIGDQNRVERQSLTSILSSVKNLSLALIAVSLISSVVLAGIAFWVIAIRIANPVQHMTDAMGRLAEGDKSIRIPATDRKDEVGEMAKAVRVFKDNMVKTDQMMAEQAKERTAKDNEAKRVMDLCAAFEMSAASALESVASAATEMQSTAESMSSTAEQTNQQATAVATASEQATVNVQTVSSAAEEMSASIGEIGRQVEQSAQIARRAVTEAEKTNGTVQGLAEAAEKIGAVVELITTIAEQTNLLALNATIEAARAGEAGKGFAVVASEVKNLANQTAKATDDIGSQIAGIQSVAGDAVTAIGGIGKTITEVNEIAGTIASSVEEQNSATEEIARNVQEAASGTQEVSNNISGVSQGAEETGKAADQVLESAGQLSQQSEELRTAVGKFLADIKTA